MCPDTDRDRPHRMSVMEDFSGKLAPGVPGETVRTHSTRGRIALRSHISVRSHTVPEPEPKRKEPEPAGVDDGIVYCAWADSRQ